MCRSEKGMLAYDLKVSKRKNSKKTSNTVGRAGAQLKPYRRRARIQNGEEIPLGQSTTLKLLKKKEESGNGHVCDTRRRARQSTDGSRNTGGKKVFE